MEQNVTTEDFQDLINDFRSTITTLRLDVLALTGFPSYVKEPRDMFEAWLREILIPDGFKRPTWETLCPWAIERWTKIAAGEERLNTVIDLNANFVDSFGDTGVKDIATCNSCGQEIERIYHRLDTRTGKTNLTSLRRSSGCSGPHAPR